MATVPLFRLQGHGDHFYTTSPQERDNAVSQYGYALEGIAGYVQSDPDPVAPPKPAERIIVTTDADLRDQFALSVLSSLIAGRFHAGKYVGDPARNLPVDTEFAYAAANEMMAARTRYAPRVP